jgi:hypothetical protein
MKAFKARKIADRKSPTMGEEVKKLMKMIRKQIKKQANEGMYHCHVRNYTYNIGVPELVYKELRELGYKVHLMDDIIIVDWSY